MGDRTDRDSVANSRMETDVVDRFAEHQVRLAYETFGSEDHFVADVLRTLTPAERTIFRDRIETAHQSPRSAAVFKDWMRSADVLLFRRSRFEACFRRIRDMIDAGPDSWPVATAKSWRTRGREI